MVNTVGRPPIKYTLQAFCWIQCHFNVLFPFPSSQTVLDICWLLPETKFPEVVVSLVALTVLIVIKEINTKYRQKLPLPIPIELILVSLFAAGHQQVAS